MIYCDSVDHDILLNRLRLVGLSENAISLFIAYLKGRTQCVQMEGVQSDSLEVVKGVPQGSVLGPLIFSIYIYMHMQTILWFIAQPLLSNIVRVQIFGYYY